MEVFRISRAKYARSIKSSGASNRWNLENEYVVYTAGSRSLATLELVVRRSAIQPKFVYKMMVISIADDEGLFTQIPEKKLPKNWRSVKAYPKLQQTGSDWYAKNKSLILKVPSAIIDKEYNYIINTRHPDYKGNVKLVRSEAYFWDDRLV
ncbi:MAG: RES family NAD+ phosphorylase [Cyclobacteriaceae bacterium]